MRWTRRLASRSPTLRIGHTYSSVLILRLSMEFYASALMAKIQSFDTIAYLVHRKYPTSNGLFAGRVDTEDFCTLTKEIICCAKAMEDYRKELSSKTPEEIDALVNSERERSRQEAAEEEGRFFNLPSAKADFDHYFNAACWTLEECVALFFGKDPNQVNWRTIKPFRSHSIFARKFEKLRDLTRRAEWVGELNDNVFPSEYLAWTEEHEIALSEELINHAVERGLSWKTWRDRYHEEKSQSAAVTKKHAQELEELKQTLRDARAEIAALRDRQAPGQSRLLEHQAEKPLATKERESLVKLAGGMAIRGYGFDPTRSRNDATADIRNDLEALGIGLNDDTIRKYLSQGADLIPRQNLENLKRKPNSDKP